MCRDPHSCVSRIFVLATCLLDEVVVLAADLSAVWLVRGLCCIDVTSLPAEHLGFFFDSLS